MSRPTVDQASKQNFVVNIQDSEFGKLVVRWREQDNGNEKEPQNWYLSQDLDFQT